MMLILIIFIISSIIYKRKSLPVKLFVEAQKIEIEGRYEEAVISYASVLEKVKKTRFHRRLKDKIIDKVKVLNTAIAYKNNLRFTR